MEHNTECGGETLDLTESDKLQLQQYRNRLFEAIYNVDFPSFDLILQDVEVKRRLKLLNLCTSVNSNGLTLMQEAAKVKNAEFVKSLLQSNVNGNHWTKNGERPVLIAAHSGNWRVLEEFKRYNDDIESRKTIPIDFAVWTKSNQDTVLHLVFKRSLIEEGYSQDVPGRNQGLEDSTQKQRNSKIKS